MEITERCSKYVISVTEVLLLRRQKLLRAWVQERRLNQERYFNLNEILIVTFVSSMEDDKDCVKSLSHDPLQNFNAPFNTRIIRRFDVVDCIIKFTIWISALKVVLYNLMCLKSSTESVFWVLIFSLYDVPHNDTSCNWEKSEPNGVKCEIFSIWSIAYNSICVRWRQE